MKDSRLTTLSLVGAALAIPLPFVSAIDLIDDFDGTELDTAFWTKTGTKTVTVSGGTLNFADDGPGDWQTGDLSTNQLLILPPAGQTTTIEWTLGPGSVTSTNGENRAIRYQIGIKSANETATSSEHYSNTTGGLWLDVDAIDTAVPDLGAGAAYSANDQKSPNGQGTNEGGFSFAWNWETESHILKLAFTDTEYNWYEGDNLIVTGTFANAGIDTEFANGFRIVALGMNWGSGRGTTSYEKIEILNATELPDTIVTFEAGAPSTVSGQQVNLDWLADAGASLSLDQGIGNVDALTTNGEGTYSFAAPVVTEPTTLTYVLTASLGGETSTRTLELGVFPENFVEEFDQDALDSAMWTKTGNQTYTIFDGKMNWDANGTDWSHGEIESKGLYPIPQGADTTVITWVYGPSAVTVDNGDGSAIRPLMGIFSGNENETYSKQHWQNDEGGIWLDLTQMGETRTDGASGFIRIANDGKPREENAEELVGGSFVDIPDWNWQTENHEFSLVLSATGFTWFNGTTEIGSGLYADYALDTEFENGFGVMAMAGNSNAGRGTMSFESISLDASATPFDTEIIITNAIDNNDGTMTLTWSSINDAEYAIETSSTLNGDWVEDLDGITGTGTSTSFSVNTSGDKLFFRVVRIP